MTAPTRIEPVRKTVTVPLSPDEAFRAFTEEIESWWPLATHSIAGPDAVGVVMEPGVGGRLVETARDGTTCVWGTVAAWEPGERVAFSFHPGWPVEQATDVEVTFTATATDGDGTEVVLVHTGWENRPDGAAMREHYVPGWDFVLGHYVDRTGASSSSFP